jgi:Putative beta-lactamase-inhibitor-like, PepSY-like
MTAVRPVGRLVGARTGGPYRAAGRAVSGKESAMRRAAMLLGSFAAYLVLGTGPVRAQEEAVPPDKIPKAVMDALVAKFPKAKIDKCTKAKEGDDVVYDIEFKQEERKCEADIKENGTYVNYEVAIAEKDLPKAVREAIDKKYPKATLKEIMEEKEVKGAEEKLSAYEVVLVTAEKKDVEVRVSPEGKILEDTGEKKDENKK